jgi:DNA-binding XRE family transcriptional regulator
VIDRYHDHGEVLLGDVAIVGQLIAGQRAKLGITQQQLAFTIGVNRRVIGELERGKQTVQLAIALQALEAVGLRIFTRVKP